jgi:hypothetical protein
MPPPAPLTLKLKRKADDIPLEALYIESDTTVHSDAENKYIYRRVKSRNEKSLHESLGKIQQFRQPVDANGIPIVLPTTSDDPAALSAQLQSFEARVNGTATASKSTSSPSAAAPRPHPKPRRFYLSKPLSPVPHNRQITDPRTRRRRHEPPVFEERVGSAPSAQADQDVTMTTEAQKPERKRPIVTAAEKAFRQERQTVQDTSRATEEAMQLPPEMQHLLAEVNTKDPAQRRSETSTTAVDHMDVDFVYDTYIRELIQSSTSSENPQDLHTAYGLAVLDETDPYWEDWKDSFLDEFDDDAELEDEEDSNAEDAPGADYPDEDEYAFSDEDRDGGWEEDDEGADEDENGWREGSKDGDERYYLDDEQEYLRDQGFRLARLERDENGVEHGD